MIPEEVCHFTKTETALEKILVEQKLKIGRLRFTNDPRESKLRRPVLSYLAGSSIGGDPKFPGVLAQLENEIEKVGLDEWKVLCVSLHNAPKRGGDHHKLIYNHRMSPAYYNPAMWAHYADNHKGVCLIFDGEILDRKIRRKFGHKCKVISGKVQYNVNSKITGIPELPIKNLDFEVVSTIRDYYFLHFKELFLHKLPAWRYENEYRWLVHSLKNNDLYISIKGALTTVITGIDFPKEKITHIKNMCKSMKASVHQMDWENGLGHVSFFEDLKW